VRVGWRRVGGRLGARLYCIVSACGADGGTTREVCDMYDKFDRIALKQCEFMY
jgi:hypothetical protein